MKASSLRWLVALLLVIPLNGCGGCKKHHSSSGGSGGGGGTTNDGTVADLDVDSDRNGTVDNTDAAAITLTSKVRWGKLKRQKT